MTINATAPCFPGDEFVLRRIVRAIQKAIEEDVPEFCQDHPMETMNSIRYVRGDKINNNLRHLVVSDEVFLIPFKRFSWDGRILVDINCKATYSITTQQNLASIPKKRDRSQPHFLQTFLAIENGDLCGVFSQESLFPIERFDEAVYKADYEKIVSCALSPDSGYRHHIIAYEYRRDELLDVKAMLLDRDFNTVDEISLNNYLIPNYMILTDEQANQSNHMSDREKSTRDLVKIKPGIRPIIIESETEEKA